MPAWQNEKIADLARQLTYSPAEKRSAQIAAAADLLPQIDPTLQYPWEFVLFRVTGYRPQVPVESSLSGQSLRADLSRLVEFLSATLAIPVAQAGQPVLSLEDITRRFGVSTKTIQRWRRQGLLARRFVYPDGRRRIGFLLAAVEQFVRANTLRVQSAAHFRQLSEDEKAQIIRRARRFAARGPCSLKDITHRIARRLNRSPETVRYTIRKHDETNPAAAIFPRSTGPIRPADRQTILEYFNRGMTVESIARRYCRTRSSIYRVVSQERAERLKAAVIEFIPNPLFDHPDADHIILQELPQQALAQATATVAAGQNAKTHDMLVARVPGDLPAYLADIFRQPVMPQEMETDAFRRMNYLKFKAGRLREKLEPSRATSSQVAEIEALLAHAHSLKNQIIPGNLRIAVHVARKHQRVGSGANRATELTALVSDASFWLLRAVERFDFARGVKFSTYASYAIMKNFARGRVEQIARPDTHLVTGQEEILEQIGARETVSITDQVEARAAQHELTRVIQRLPERERALVAARFGLNQNQPPLSLAELGAQLGITKSRVRQLETRALRKLRQWLEPARPIPATL